MSLENELISMTIKLRYIFENYDKPEYSEILKLLWHVNLKLSSAIVKLWDLKTKNITLTEGKNKMEKPLLGTTIKVKDVHKEAIKTLLESCNRSKIAFETAVKMIENSTKELWGTIDELYPETKPFRKAIKHDSLEIILKSFIEELE